MKYLAVTNWARYQHYKDRRPPWIKYYLDMLDDEITELPYEAQLLFDRLLLVAGKRSNVLRDDIEWLAGMTRIDAETVARHLPSLLKGAWLTRTRASKTLASCYQDASETLAPRALARGRGTTTDKGTTAVPTVLKNSVPHRPSAAAAGFELTEEEAKERIAELAQPLLREL